MHSFSNEKDKRRYHFDESEERYFSSPDLPEMLLILDLLCNDYDLIQLNQHHKSKESSWFYIEIFLKNILDGGIKDLREMKRNMLNKRR